MKTLTLIRHAKSDWHRAAATDFERGLNKRGVCDVPNMANHLALSGLRPDVFCSSPAARAAATAKPIAAALGYAADRIVWNSELYLATAGELLRVIGQLPAAADHAVLVGHNPGLTDLVNRLAAASLENVPTCSVATIELPADSWHALKPGSGNLTRFDTPRQLWGKSSES